MVNIGSIKRFFLDSARFGWACSLALCLWLLIGFPAPSLAQATLAQVTDPASVVTSAIAPEAEIAAEKIDQFAQAYLQILQLLSDREAEIPAAETNAEALKIEKSIEADAIAIIQSSSLTLPEYMQILGLASQDTAFQDKVLGRMDDTQEAP